MTDRTKQLTAVLFNELKGHFDLVHGATFHYSIQFRDGNWEVEIDVADPNGNDFLMDLYGVGSTLDEALSDSLSRYDGCSACD